MSDDSRAALTRTLVRLVLFAAVLTAPVFLFGEGFEAEYVGRVALERGLRALCLGLLRLLARGRHELAGLPRDGPDGAGGRTRVVQRRARPRQRRELRARRRARRRDRIAPAADLVAGVSAVEMSAIAWTRPFAEAGKDLGEARFMIVQFLPTYLVVVTVLWLRRSGRNPGEAALVPFRRRRGRGRAPPGSRRSARRPASRTQSARRTPQAPTRSAARAEALVTSLVTPIWRTWSETRRSTSPLLIPSAHHAAARSGEERRSSSKTRSPGSRSRARSGRGSGRGRGARAPGARVPSRRRAPGPREP